MILYYSPTDPRDFSTTEIKREIARGAQIRDLYMLSQQMLSALEISNESIKYYASLVREQTQAGLDAAREKRRIGGRPSLSKSDRKVQLAQEMTEKGMKIKDVCLALGISRSTYYRYLKLNESI